MPLKFTSQRGPLLTQDTKDEIDRIACSFLQWPFNSLVRFLSRLAAMEVDECSYILRLSSSIAFGTMLHEVIPILASLYAGSLGPVQLAAMSVATGQTRSNYNLAPPIFQNGAKSRFEMRFAIGPQHLWCRGSQPKHVSNPG